MGFLRKATFVATGGLSGVAIKANSKKERTARAAEQQLALERRAAKAEEARQAAEQKERTRQRIEAGAWWLEDGAFHGLRRALSGVRYLGGWSGIPANPKLLWLRLSADGLQLSGAVKAVLTIPWSKVTELTIEDTGAGRPAVAEVNASNDGKPSDKPAVVVVKTQSGDEAVFLVESKSVAELQEKFGNLTQRLADGAARAASHTVATPPRTSPACLASVGTSPVSLGDELAKLAALHDSGVLTEEEFSTQKARLLRA